MSSSPSSTNLSPSIVPLVSTEMNRLSTILRSMPANPEGMTKALWDLRRHAFTIIMDIHNAHFRGSDPLEGRSTPVEPRHQNPAFAPTPALSPLSEQDLGDLL